MQYKGYISAFTSYFVGMFGLSDLPFANLEFGYVFVRNFLLFAILCFACTPYPKEIFIRVKEKIKGENKKTVFTFAFDVLLVVIFALCIVYISSSDYRPNIYFEF